MPSKTVPNREFGKTKSNQIPEKKVFKYRIAELLRNLSRTEKGVLNRKLHQNGIHTSTFHVYRNIEFNELADIPAQKLEIIAILLNVSPEFLKNYITQIDGNGQVFYTQKV